MTQSRTLSAPQQAILEAGTSNPDPAAYTMVNAITVDGVLTRSLRQAATDTAARHDALHWTLNLDDRYRISASAGPSPALVPTEETDLRSLDPADAIGTVEAWMTTQRAAAYDLWDDGPRLRFHLFRLPDTPTGPSTVCALTTHHLYTDEHALQLLWTEIVRRASTPPISAPTSPDLRYSRWAEASTGAAAATSARTAAEAVAQRCQAHETRPYPGYLERPPAPNGYGQQARALGPVDTADVSARLSVGPAAVYVAAVAQAVAEQTGHGRIVLHMPMSLRRTAAEAGIVGCFVASAPLPIRVEPTGDRLVQHCQRALNFASRHAHARPGLLSRSVGRPQISLAIEQPATTRRLGPVTWNSFAAPNAGPKHPLSLQLSASATGPGRLRASWTSATLTQEQAIDLLERTTDHLNRLTAKG
ncbi:MULTISPECIES: condensation domain-containing protein [unclassified Streptomyces]|uniref:condensation domain-containing protein n=1 Tax=unclassified Streptomyces TaxID=2593676 RepID=UPI0033E942ED